MIEDEVRFVEDELKLKFLSDSRTTNRYERQELNHITQGGLFAREPYV